MYQHLHTGVSAATGVLAGLAERVSLADASDRASNRASDVSLGDGSFVGAAASVDSGNCHCFYFLTSLNRKNLFVKLSIQIRPIHIMTVDLSTFDLTHKPHYLTIGLGLLHRVTFQ